MIGGDNLPFVFIEEENVLLQQITNKKKEENEHQ